MVPPHLLYAICTISAVHSINPEIATAPPRMAGRAFAEETRRLMFDDSDQGQGTLIQPPTLATAQALALLLFYETTVNDGADSAYLRVERYREQTLSLIQTLNVHTPEHPLLTPVPSQSYILGSIDRECLRRVFWFVYIVDCITGTYQHRSRSLEDTSPSPPPMTPAGSAPSTYPPSPSANPYPPYHHPSSYLPPTPPHKPRAVPPMASASGPAHGRGLSHFSEGELRLRLPADETSFEMGTVYESLPEYLYLPGVSFTSICILFDGMLTAGNCR